MFKINYNISTTANSDLSKANEADLRYNLFLGSLILKTSKSSIVIDWDWIPLFDFALCLISISIILSKNEMIETDFEFTESDEKLIFKKQNNDISILSTFSDDILELKFNDFQTSSKSFYNEIVDEIISKNVELKKNINFNKLMKEAENM